MKAAPQQVSSLPSAQAALLQLLDSDSADWPENITALLGYDFPDELDGLIATATKVSASSDIHGQQERILSEALTKLGVPIVLLDQHGVVRFCPVQALHWLRDSGEIEAPNNGRLAPNSVLLASMRENQTNNKTDTEVRTLHLNNGVFAELHPIADRGARVILRHSDERLRMAVNNVAELYQLTTAEVKVVFALAQGLNTADIANGRNVSVATIRSQLKTIYCKLGVNSQSAVVSRCLAQASVVNAESLDLNQSNLQFAECSDGQLMSYREYGNPTGIPSIWLHDSTCSGSLFSVVDEICRLRGIRAICPDRPGYGVSMSPKLNRHTYFSHQIDMLSEFADALGLRRFAVVSFQQATCLAIHWSVREPNRVRSLLLLGASTRPSIDSQKAYSERIHPFHMRLLETAQKFPSFFLKAMPLALKAATKHPHAYFQAMEKGLGEADLAVITNPKLRRHLINSGTEAITDFKVPAYDMLSAFEFNNEHLHEIKIPVHIWQGQQDQTTPYELATQMQANLANCEVTICPDHGRLAILTDPNRIIDASFNSIFKIVNKL